MRKILKRHIVFVGLLVFIVLWSIMLYFKRPEELIGMIGVKNGYIISFFVGVFGGAATFTTISYYPVVGTLAAGGLNPIILGIIAGTGLTIGNALYFYFGYKGRVILSGKTKERVEKAVKWIEKKPDLIVRLAMLLYVGFTPLPNNLLTATGGLTDYPFKKMIGPLFIGNIILSTMIAQVVVMSMA